MVNLGDALPESPKTVLKMDINVCCMGTNGRGIRTDDDVVIASRNICWDGDVDRTIYEREARSKGLGFNRGLRRIAMRQCYEKTLTNIQMLILRRRVEPTKQDRARRVPLLHRDHVRLPGDGLHGLGGPDVARLRGGDHGVKHDVHHGSCRHRGGRDQGRERERGESESRLELGEHGWLVFVDGAGWELGD